MAENGVTRMGEGQAGSCGLKAPNTAGSHAELCANGQTRAWVRVFFEKNETF